MACTAFHTSRGESVPNLRSALRRLVPSQPHLIAIGCVGFPWCIEKMFEPHSRGLFSPFLNLWILFNRELLKGGSGRLVATSFETAGSFFGARREGSTTTSRRNAFENGVNTPKGVPDCVNTLPGTCKSSPSKSSKVRPAASNLVFTISSRFRAKGSVHRWATIRLM